MEVRQKLLCLALLLIPLGGLGGQAWADNVITISSTEGAPDDEVTVNVSLQNSDAVSSLQVSIPLDENLTLVNESGLLGSRCSSHSLTVGVKDGVLNVFVYSTSMANITGNSGVVASFKLKLGNQPQTANLTPSKTVLTNSSGSEVEVTAESGAVTTRCAKAQYSTMEVDFGEVPIHSSYSRTVTVTNVGNATLTITGLTFSDLMAYSSTTTLPLNIAAGQSADLNITYAPEERGNTTRTLKVDCNSVSKLNTITLRAQPFAVNELHIQPTSGISDEEVTVSMTMNNMDDISGFQVEFTLPDQLEYVANSVALSSRKQDHSVIASLNGNVLRIIAYSPTDKALTGDDGVIATFKLKLVGRNGITLTPTKTVLSATINNVVTNVMSAVYGGYIDISSPTISTNDELNFGAVPVTETCEQTFTISNWGSAPLTVSRIEFNNENLSVQETLPLVIAAGSNSNVTVAYNSVEQTSFAGVMQIYSNDPELRLREVNVSGSRFAPNFISMSATEVCANEKLSVNLSVDNYDALTGLQFDLVYPGQYYEPFDNNYTLTNRATGMTVNILQTDPNTLRCFCYFLGGGSIAAGSGKVMTIQLKTKTNSVPTGNYGISVTNIKMGTSDMDDKYAGDETVQDNFTVNSLLKGDVNQDGYVTAQDASLVLQAVAHKITLSSTALAAADVNGDNELTAQDASLILQYVAGKINW